MTLTRNLTRSLTRNLVTGLTEALAQAFEPTQLTGLNLWLNAADTSDTSITELSGAVSGWLDQSNKGNDAIQLSGANQPVTGTRTQNGLNVIDFNGAAHYLSADSVASALTGSDTPFSLFVVCAPDNIPTAANEAIVSSASSTHTASRIRPTLQSTNVTRFNRADSTGAAANADATSVSGFQLQSYLFLGTTLTSFLNGTKENDEISFDVGTLTLDTFTIGAVNSLSVNSHFDGTIGEVILYDRRLPDAEIEAVQTYLNKKWSIY